MEETPTKESVSVDEKQEKVVELDVFRQRQGRQEGTVPKRTVYEGTISYLDLTTADQTEAADSAPLEELPIRLIKVSSGFGKSGKEWAGGDIRCLAA
jgi:hypothetical protein